MTLVRASQMWICGGGGARGRRRRVWRAAAGVAPPPSIGRRRGAQRGDAVALSRPANGAENCTCAAERRQSRTAAHQPCTGGSVAWVGRTRRPRWQRWPTLRRRWRATRDQHSRGPGESLGSRRVATHPPAASVAPPRGLRP
eukprot:scaffold2368_cov72-Phaeocystis_antarctica.AAC.9